VKVMGKGARERIVPVGAVARQALVRYLRQANVADTEAAIFRARGGAPYFRQSGSACRTEIL